MTLTLAPVTPSETQDRLCWSWEIRNKSNDKLFKSITLKGLEARTGTEPMSTDLQKLAVLLRYCIYR